jgi:hypothetical protein
MGEIIIKPIHNVHKKYRKVNFVNPYIFNSALDADASAFLIATGIPNDGTVFYSGTAQQITGSAMHTAMHSLVSSLKIKGIWSKIKAFYPFIGGTSASHKFNLKDPRDLDIAFRLAYVNSSSHSSLGFQSNGSNSYANTFLNLSTVFSSKAMALGMYTTAATTLVGDRHNMGAHSGSANFFSFQENRSLNFLQSNSNMSTTADWPGFLCGTTTPTTHKLIANTLITTALVTNGNLPNVNVWIGCLNFGNSYYGGTNSKMGAVWFCSELTDTEVLDLRTSVINFQTALHRNI